MSSGFQGHFLCFGYYLGKVAKYAFTSWDKALWNGGIYNFLVFMKANSIPPTLGAFVLEPNLSPII